MKFTKMHGLGNDYIYVYGEPGKDVAKLSINLSRRHFSVGSDGMIFIMPSEIADFKMRIFNADGSEAKMCGNGIRCVGKYVYDKGYTDKTDITVETLSGIKKLRLNVENGKVKSAVVDMGKVVVSSPVTLNVSGDDYKLIPVDMGNPHAVIICSDAENAPLDTVGKAIEKHEFFPGGVNVEFVEVLDGEHLRMRVWERGSGITMACGTGACASVSAAVKSGKCAVNRPISVLLDGGTLVITVDGNDEVFMDGPCETVYEGEILC